MSEYLSHDEAAKRVGFSRYVISEWVKEGKIERFQRDGKNYFLAEEVDDAADLHDPHGNLCFADDYNHLRDYGMSHREIAERVGMDYKSFMKRITRMGLYRGTPYEERAAKVLDRLIASGEPFVSEALPCLQFENVAAQLVKRAVGEKRIRAVGKRKSQFADSAFLLNVYVGVAA